MAFTVEDGTIVTGANAYIDVAFLDAYFADRNVTLTETEAQKQAAIVISTQYVDLNNRWKGEIVSDAQALDFPRKNVYDDEGRKLDETTIPAQLKNAVAEYAKRQLVSDIQPDVQTDDLGNITSISQTVFGAVQESKTFEAGTGGYYGLKRYPLADKYLVGLRVGGVSGNMGRLVRGGYGT